MREIYLDANASSPPLACAKEAVLTLLDSIGNASSPHSMGRKARAVIDQARTSVAQALRGQEKELFFTSGATEGNRWLIDACLQSEFKQPLKIVTSPLEHPSVVKPLVYAQSKGLISLQFLPLLNQKVVPDTILHDADVLMVSSSHNETGLITDLEALGAQLPPHSIFISDATQSATRCAPLPQRVDAIVVSGHKMGAFPGVGAVLLRNNARKLLPPWQGGGQESGLRPGTEALHLIAAFGAAAQIAPQMRQEHAKLASFRDELEQKLSQGRPWVNIIGQHLPRLPNTTALSLAGVNGDALRILIDAAQVCVGFGSACSALAPEPSPSLIALGLSPDQAKATVRLSLHPGLSPEDIQEAGTRLSAVFDSLSKLILR